MIKLTLASTGEHVVINEHHILQMDYGIEYTLIRFSIDTNKYLEVKETPEEIMNLINPIKKTLDKGDMEYFLELKRKYQYGTTHIVESSHVSRMLAEIRELIEIVEELT